MGYYSWNWANEVVNRWWLCNPRVISMCDRFISWLAELNVCDPDQYLKAKLIYYVRRSGTRREWIIIKDAVDHVMTHRRIFLEFIYPQELNFPDKDPTPDAEHETT